MARTPRPAPSGPKPPTVDRVSTPAGLVEVSADDVRDGDHRERERYAGADFSGRDLAFTTFTECDFVGVRLHEADLRSLHLVDCRLSEVDAAVFTAPRSAWRSVAVTGSRLGSMETYESTWRSVVVEDCKLAYLNARGAIWQDVTFRNCVIEDLDLGQTKATRVSFEGCRIASLSVTRATLVDVDLRGADLHVLKGMTGLAGAWVTEEQLTLLAPLLATELGIKVG